MTLRLIESFDTYTGNILTEGRWTSSGLLGAGAAVGVQAGIGRRDTQGLRVTKGASGGGYAYVRKTFGPQQTWIVGFAYRSVTFPSLGNEVEFVGWLDDTGYQMDLMALSDGTIRATRAGTVLGTSGPVLFQNTYAYIEWQVTISTTIGSCLVRVNGLPALSLTNINTQATPNAYATQLQLGNRRLVANQSIPQDFDDLYLCDSTGAAPQNSLLGDCRVDVLVPTGDQQTDFTPSVAGAHYSLVDELPPNTTDYVDSNTVGHIDRYVFSDLPPLTNPVILGLGVNIYAMNPEAGPRQLQATALSGVTAQDGAAFAVTNAWQLTQTIYPTDPGGGGAWTPATVNAAQFGVKVAA